jgi:N-acetylneuraminate synthase
MRSDSRIYVIAEAGVNHNGQRDLAFDLVKSAAEAGADAVKFQTFDAKKLATLSAPKAAYQKVSTSATESQLAMLERLELPHAWHHELKTHATSMGIDFLSTAFDHDSLAFLVNLDVPMLKVPSGELTNGPLLWAYAHTQKPLIVSTGMATLSEVEQGLAIIAHAYNSASEPCSMDEVWKCWSQSEIRLSLRGRVTLLHCTSQYPTSFAEVNLRGMDTLGAAFGLPTGYSDHTEGILVPIAAAARGARVIEKHFTLDRNLPGPDQKASLEPKELAQMVSNIRSLELVLGDGSKCPHPSEWDSRITARQQVIAARDIASGTRIGRLDLTTARCGAGLPPTELWGLVGQVTTRSYRAGDVIER